MKIVEFKIEKGIPLPPRGAYNNKGYRDAIKKLQKGDSILLPTGINSANSLSNKILGPGNYACRSEEGGFTRVWRTK